MCHVVHSTWMTPVFSPPFQYEWGKIISQITRSVASYHVPVEKSIYFSKDTTCRKTALMGTSNWLGMWESIIFPDHLVFVRVRLIELNADIIGTTTLHVSDLERWKYSPDSPGRQYSFWFTILAGGCEQFHGLPLGFLCYKSSYPRSQGINV